jgi:hypothetical protein
VWYVDIIKREGNSKRQSGVNNYHHDIAEILLKVALNTITINQLLPPQKNKNQIAFKEKSVM